jgi:hypothetical protein
MKTPDDRRIAVELGGNKIIHCCNDEFSRLPSIANC